MGRTIARWLIGVLSLVLMLGGLATAGAAWWVRDALRSDDSLRTTPQVVPATGCQTLLVEIADAALQADDVISVPGLGVEPQSWLSVVPEGPADAWLVGLAASPDVEGRLLGSSYCLASESSGEWSSQTVSVRPGDPQIALGGLEGLWARTDPGTAAIIPVPTAGQTLVVAAQDGGELADVRIEGVYRLVGASQAAYVGLIGGLMTTGLGFVLLLISIFAFRRRGRHEAGSATS